MDYKGLFFNASLDDYPAGYGRFARNIVKHHRLGAVCQEPGFSEEHNFGKKVIGVISTDREAVIFSGTGATSEIGVFSNGVYTTKVVSAKLELNAAAPVEGEAYYDSNGNLIVCWWNGVQDESTAPKILNLTCLPFEVDFIGVPINDEDLDQLYLFTKYTKGKISIDSINNAGGRLTPGSKYFMLAFEHEDGSVSNYFHITNPVYITDDSYSSLNGSFVEPKHFNVFDGVVANEVTSKSVTLNFDNLPSWVKKVRLGIYHNNKGIISASYVPNIDVSGTTKYTYTGNGEVDVAIDELLIPSDTFAKVHTGTNNNGNLILGNVKKLEYANLQPYVNEASVTWRFADEKSLTQTNDGTTDLNNEKNLQFLVDAKSFKSNEVYALFLIAHYINGDKVAYHIPGRSVASVSFTTESGNNITCNDDTTIASLLISYPADTQLLEWNKLGPDVKVFQVLSTATASRMGYWENENEVYPDNSCSVLGNGPGTLAGEKIRHHRFPSAALLNNEVGFWNAGSGDTDNLIGYLESTGGYTGGALNWSVVTNNFFAEIGTFGAGNNEIVLDRDVRLRLRIDYRAIDAHDDVQVYFRITSNNYNTIHYEADLDNATTNVSVPDTDHHIYVFIEGKAGDKIAWRFTRGASDDGYLDYGRIWFEEWDFNHLDIRTYQLGIDISNLNIPANLESNIAYYELGYAERTTDNALVMCSGYLAAGSVEYAKMYGPDSSVLLPDTARASYIETHLDIQDLTTSPGVPDITTLVTHNRWRRVKTSDVKYIAAFSYQPEYSNVKREGFLYLPLDTNMAGTGLYSPRTQVNAYADVMTYRTEVYADLSKQTIVRTGHHIPVATTSQNGIYGGDIHHQLFGWYEIHKRPLTLDEARIEEYRTVFTVPILLNGDNNYYTFIGHVFFAESVVNSGLRYSSGDDVKYCPKWAVPVRYLPIVEDTVHAEFHQLDNVWEYDSHYHTVNNIQRVIVYECNDDCNTEDKFTFPYDVFKSTALSSENTEFSWRVFPVNDNYSMPKNRDYVWVLRSMNRALIIHQRSGLHIAYIKDRLQESESLIYLGTGDLFDRQPDEVIYTKEGYAGCQNKFAAYVTKAGYVFLDRTAGKVFIFIDTLIEISAESGNGKQWFLDNLSVNYDITDLSSLEDNPFTGKGFALGWDERHDRFILTKNINNLGESSYTISYDIRSREWVAFHDYFANFYFWFKNKYFSINNSHATDALLYQHNNGEFVTFYNGNTYDAYVEIVFNLGQQGTWQHIIFDTRYFVNDATQDYQKTAKAIVTYNEHQCSGQVNLVVNGNTVIQRNTKHRDYKWRFNNFRDLVSNPASNFITDKGVLIGANINTNKPFYKQGLFNSSSLVVRIVLSSGTDRTYVHDIEAIAAIKRIN